MDIEIPGYEIERELGDGAMATVYLATQRSLERKVALKIMGAALAADRSFCERFLREGKTLARLSHPNTVTIYDIGNAGSHYYMAMEYLSNGTLKERIADGLSADQGVKYLRQIASALGYAHAQGLVHRDVKPANILFRADGTAVLSDFGIAKSLEDRTQFTQAGFAVGTPSYMSPEQARGQEIDGRADLYALGVVLYEILTGKLPYVGADSLSTALAHLTEPLPELPVTQGRHQPILNRLLAKDPNQRFPDAAALIDALDRLPAEAASAQLDNDATQFRPLGLPAGPAPVDRGGLDPVAISIPSVEPLPAGTPADLPTRVPPPAPAVPPPRTDVAKAPSAMPKVAAAAAVLLLLLSGGAYWLFGQGSTPQPEQDGSDGATDAPPQVEDKPAAAASQTAGEPAPAAADGGDRPLLMAGKKTLFQRVLSKPGAALAEAPGAGKGQPVPAFSVLYVYQRQDHDGQQWLQVGGSSDGQRDGWLPSADVSDWKQSLVLKFTERSGRSPVMFLKDAAAVERYLADPTTARTDLRQVQVEGSGAADIVAVEPAESAIPQEQFYLLPIFDSRETFDANGLPVQLLNVASIDPGDEAGQVVGDGSQRYATDDFRTGIVLVVDTSVSMQPYIDRVGQVIQEVQRRIASQGDLGSVSFGLIGFRNNVEKTPGLEYVSQVLVNLEQGKDPQRFAELARGARATQVSSHSFNEDAFAGIMEAVDSLDWTPYSGRLLLLVTDAGALRKDDPLGRTRMNESEVREAALGKQVKIYALHLRTSAGQDNHGFAEQQYRSLTADANPQIGDLYIPVADGSVARFGETVGEIGLLFADLVHQVRSGQLNKPPQGQQAHSIAGKTSAIGYAMQMDFLGRRAAVHAPQLVTAWTADRDLANPQLPAFQVCVLLTKLQLNELQQSLKLIVDAALRTESSPRDFFQEIASASAYISRDPRGLTRGANLAESGVLGEYLEGLPYRSKTLGMTQDLWLSLSVAEQQDFIDELESKIRLYETFHNDIANWVRFGDAQPGDALYRVPLSTLP
ncbi:Serine/threonine-protein kinase PrkC [compost metagenome]